VVTRRHGGTAARRSATGRLISSNLISCNQVGDWEASHFNWKDSLTIESDGRFARGNGDGGSWHVVERDGRTILRLEWDRWPTEELELQPTNSPDAAGGADVASSPRRHVFRGHGTLVSTGLDPRDQVGVRDALACEMRLSLPLFPLHPSAPSAHSLNPGGRSSSTRCQPRRPPSPSAPRAALPAPESPVSLAGCEGEAVPGGCGVTEPGVGCGWGDGGMGGWGDGGGKD